MTELTIGQLCYTADFIVAERERRAKIYASSLPQEIITNLLSEPEDGPEYKEWICE